MFSFYIDSIEFSLHHHHHDSSSSYYYHPVYHGVVVQITMIVTPSKDVDVDLHVTESVPMIVDLELDVVKKLRKVEEEHVIGEMTRTKHARRKGPSQKVMFQRKPPPLLL